MTKHGSITVNLYKYPQGARESNELEGRFVYVGNSNNSGWRYFKFTNGKFVESRPPKFNRYGQRSRDD